MGAGGLDSVNPRRPRQRTKLDCLPPCLGARAGESAAAHLDHDVVERAAARAGRVGLPVGAACQRRDDLVAERLAALYRQPVLIALAGERNRAAIKFRPHRR